MPSRREAANAIRALAMDAVEKAQSGHPGMPMGMADIAEVLWTDFIRHNPNNPTWANRDRFVLSNGHGCMLWYAVAHLSGYAVSIEDIKQFRQLHSITPGHPEYKLTPGVEVTTGPLGQGFANSVGMALAEALLADEFNRPDHEIINHFTYVFAGDGCLMEGISHEAGSLAGTLGLGRLIAFYDNNGISIDGKVNGWFRDDTAARFEAYGWHVVRDVDGHDPESVNQAIKAAQQRMDKPSLILCRTVIGFGAPDKQGTAAVHGSALGAEEVKRARETLGWHHPPFFVPREIYDYWDARERGQHEESDWNRRYDAYAKAYPELASELSRRLKGSLPENCANAFSKIVADIAEKGESRATRKSSGAVLNRMAQIVPELFGGSADLTGSNNTSWEKCTTIQPGHLSGNYLHYGVREFGMTALLNGMAAHGGFVPFGGTFLVFSDYARNAVRLAALSGYPNILVYTHDSIALGEDGPTHQPIEHLASLRAMPGLVLWRPADDVETAVAWQDAVERRDGPTALVLTRQSVPHYERDKGRLAEVRRGGYVLYEPAQQPRALIMATGSEVALAMDAAKRLTDDGKATRVVSLPSVEVFEQQPEEWRDSVLPAAIQARVAVEAGVAQPWYRWVGEAGAIVSLERYGESAPKDDVLNDLGFTSEHIVAVVEDTLAKISVQ